MKKKFVILLSTIIVSNLLANSSTSLKQGKDLNVQNFSDENQFIYVTNEYIQNHINNEKIKKTIIKKNPQTKLIENFYLESFSGIKITEYTSKKHVSGCYCIDRIEWRVAKNSDYFLDELDNHYIYTYEGQMNVNSKEYEELMNLLENFSK